MMRGHRHRSWSPLGQCVLQLGSDPSGSGMLPCGPAPAARLVKNAPRPPRPTDSLTASALASTPPWSPASDDLNRPIRSVQQCARTRDEVSNFASDSGATWPLVGLTTCAYSDQSLRAALSARIPLAHGGAPDAIKTAHDAEDKTVTIPPSPPLPLLPCTSRSISSSFKMISARLTAVLPVVLAATIGVGASIVPRCDGSDSGSGSGSADSCNTGPIQCCNQTFDVRLPDFCAR